MAQHQKKYLGKSKKYKGVYKIKNTVGKITFDGVICGRKKQGFEDERDCALWVDKQLLADNKEPVNILVRK